MNRKQIVLTANAFAKFRPHSLFIYSTQIEEIEEKRSQNVNATRMCVDFVG